MENAGGRITVLSRPGRETSSFGTRINRHDFRPCIFLDRITRNGTIGGLFHSPFVREEIYMAFDPNTPHRDPDLRTTPNPPRGSSRWVAWIAGIVVIAIAAFAIINMMNEPGTDPSTTSSTSNSEPAPAPATPTPPANNNAAPAPTTPPAGGGTQQ